jgi:hypothetical protein
MGLQLRPWLLKLVVVPKAGHELARSRLGPSHSLARPFSARLGLARWADKPGKGARLRLYQNSV